MRNVLDKVRQRDEKIDEFLQKSAKKSTRQKDLSKLGKMY